MLTGPFPVDVYPEALWRPVPGWTTTGPLSDTQHWKIVYHKTQGDGDPFSTYQRTGGIPDLTLHKDGQFDQHYTFNRYSRALRNLWGGVQTNLDGVIQIEIVGWVDLPMTAPQVAALVAFVQWATRLGVAPGWLNGPPITGRSVPRLSFDAWDNGSGHCGHIDVPENNHTDPRFTQFDVDAIESAFKIKPTEGAVMALHPAAQAAADTGIWTPVNAAGVDTSKDPATREVAAIMAQRAKDQAIKAAQEALTAAVNAMATRLAAQVDANDAMAARLVDQAATIAALNDRLSGLDETLSAALASIAALDPGTGPTDSRSGPLQVQIVGIGTPVG